MLTGFLFALGACFVWGLIFVIPDFLADFSSFEVAVGRYFSYGVLSTILLLRKGTTKIRTIPLKAWGVALLFGLVSNFLYYIGVVIGLRYASAPVTVLIMGMCPILVALYGNWQGKECSYRSLVIPCLWMIGGLVLVNISEIDWTFGEGSPKDYLLGLIAVVGSLLCWSWYAVHNARFLKKNTDVPRSDWSTLLGVSTFAWVLMTIPIIGWLGGKEYIDFAKFTQINPDSLRFFGCISILGIVCSWLGCYLWNQASSHLPISIMGSFIIFETIFGLIFVYLFDLRFPSFLEFLGIVSMLGGILLCIYFFKRQAEPTQ